MSKSILDYFGSKLKSQEVKKSVSETEIIPATAESISDSEDLIEADRDKSQEVNKSISETEIIPAAAESISDGEDLFEADRDNLLTDTRLTLQQSTSGLGDAASETNHGSVVRVINDLLN